MCSDPLTKKAIIEGFKELLQDMPLTKCSVKTITDYCKISRSTFYYHFQDKYDLVNWIFYTEMRNNANAFDNPRKLADSYVNLCKYLYVNRKFYMACFQYMGQNSLFEYLYEFYYELWKNNFSIIYSEAGVRLEEDELSWRAKMGSYALVGVIAGWVKEGMRENYMDHFEQIRKILEEDMLEYPTTTSRNAAGRTRDIKRKEAQED